MAEPAAPGAPQVVIPQHYDQHYWAEPDMAARARSIAAAVRSDGYAIGWCVAILSPNVVLQAILARMAQRAALRERRGSLLEPTGNEAAEREALAEAPRPGTWFGDPGADGRMLTQDQTDALIRTELHELSPAVEREEVLAIAGGSHVLATVHMDFTGELVQVATCQRGGIDSDPLIRMLAFRAWGDRDRRWLLDRGVRVGDLVVLVEETDRSGWVYGSAWPGESPTRHAATHDAWPGQQVLCRVGGPSRRTSDAMFRVGDRPRLRPTAYRSPADRLDGVRKLYGFDELEIGRDTAEYCFVMTARVGPCASEILISDDELAQLEDPEQRVWQVLDELARNIGLAPRRLPPTEEMLPLFPRWT